MEFNWTGFIFITIMLIICLLFVITAGKELKNHKQYSIDHDFISTFLIMFTAGAMFCMITLIYIIANYLYHII